MKILIYFFCLLLTSLPSAYGSTAEKLTKLEKKILSYKISHRHKDDLYGLMVVKSALTSLKEGSGGIGACLVDSATGEIIEQGRNRQYIGYFKSDLHAEMDLLNRYEDRFRKTNDPQKGLNARDCGNLILVTSVEPCPMCLTRIINAGIKTVLYLAEDTEGGMVSRMNCLPPFWREFAADRDFRPADCSPELQGIAMDLFHFSHRNFAKNRKQAHFKK